MKRQHIAFPFVLAHAWVLMIFFGALVFDTFIVYPNTFHDVPRSLERAMAFATVRGPGDFFPPLGFASWITGIGSLILAWRIKPARYWVLASLVVIACEGLFSMAFFWPRNTIMFTEGTAIHSVAFLKQTAREFEVGHWIRFALGAAAAATSFTGFLKFYRYRILSRYAHQEAQVAVGGRSNASTDASREKVTDRTRTSRAGWTQPSADGDRREGSEPPSNSLAPYRTSYLDFGERLAQVLE